MEKREKLSVIINIIFALLILCADFVFIFSSISSYITKTTASLLFVLCGVFNFVYWFKKIKQSGNLNFAITLLVGLFFAMLGDIFLIDFFVLGAGLFALGHVLFFVSFCFLIKFSLKDILIGILIFALVLALIVFYPHFVFDGMMPLVIVYALIISLMLGKAVSNLFKKQNFKECLVIFIGALLFFVSDAMLLFYVFAHKVFVFDLICLLTYYPAEFILAFSIYFAGVNFVKKSQTIRKN